MIFFDTGFFFALKFKKDPNHTRAIKILQEISQKKFGSQLTSDYVLDELLTLTWNRTRNKSLISEIWQFFVPPNNICNVIQISMNDIFQIYEKFYNLLDRKDFLSFTDCTILFLMEKYEIEHLASFDSNFDGLTSRIH
ncbi:MAG: type II toxin-antitoxin system VapC family toxin [Candidatus Helarchaeota archaeon]